MDISTKLEISVSYPDQPNNLRDVQSRPTIRAQQRMCLVFKLFASFTLLIGFVISLYG